MQGSVHAFRRELFPRGFAGEVMQLILDTWKTFSMHRKVRLEEPITALFATALEHAYVSQNKSWFVFLEGPITDPTFGTQLGRNDLRFYHRNIPGQRVFFTVECKRLHVRTKSGFRHLADEYVKEGLQRFVDGKYSLGLPCAGMLGYVMDNRVNEAFVLVCDEINIHRSKLRMRRQNSLKCPSSVLNGHATSADTFHQRDDGPFAVYHSLVGVSDKTPIKLRWPPDKNTRKPNV
ncbi:MAG: hypothetical protein ACXWKG_00370 [Limisphaerales bacterium]